MFEKEKAPLRAAPSEGKTSTSIIPAEHSLVKNSKAELTERAIRLPKWTAPTSMTEIRSRINGHRGELIEIAKNAMKHYYLLGLECRAAKDRLDHGKFEPWVEKNTWFTPRAARRYMNYAFECTQAGELLPYHPNQPPKLKSDIVSVLISPDDEPYDLDKPAPTKKPKHEPGESLAWDATECARSVMQRFKNVTTNRTLEDWDAVKEKVDDLYHEAREEKAESIRMIRGENGPVKEFYDEGE